MYHFISLFLTISVIFSNITLDLSGFSFVLLRFLSVVCWCHIHCHCSISFFLKSPLVIIINICVHLIIIIYIEKNKVKNIFVFVVLICNFCCVKVFFVKVFLAFQRYHCEHYSRAWYSSFNGCLCAVRYNLQSFADWGDQVSDRNHSAFRLLSWKPHCKTMTLNLCTHKKS